MRLPRLRSLPRLAGLLPVAATVVAVILFWQGRIGLVHFVVAIGLGAIVTMICVIDYAYEIIPDRLSVPLLAVGLAVNGLAFEPYLAVDWEFAAGALLGGAALWIVRAGYFRLRGAEGLGLGDVKLAAGCGAWVGLQGLPAVLLLAAVGGLVWVTLSSWARGIGIHSVDRVPFGAFLAPALWIVWMLTV
jgi:leader peptidase (prepilin peptidase) / N-methyltransferase